ncbi:3,4-dihydroxy-2-butanone 4-phosphate synthase [subsurface metagenome]
MRLFNRVEVAIKAFQNRKFVILLSENEGEADLAFPAQEVTAATVLFMARVASGLLCLALPQKRLRELEVDRLPSKYAVQDTPFYESVDSRQVKSGVSATDRAATIRKVINGETKPSELSRPGHLPLLGAEPLGLLKRDGHTEAVVELCQLAGVYPGGLLCELVSDSGDMMNAKELKSLAKRFKIPIVTVGALAEFVRSSLPKREA